MGNFLEDLRKQKEAEQEPVKKYEKERLRIFEEHKAMLIASKKHFKDSGLEDLIREVAKVTKEFMWADKTQTPPYSGSYDGNSIHEITISGWCINSFNYGTYYPNGREYFRIVMTPEGEVRLDGDKDKGSSVVPASVWRNDKNALEEAFGKAYKNPIVAFHFRLDLRSSGSTGNNPSDGEHVTM